MEKETINVRKKAYEIKKIISLTGDMLVPDTKPDIINTIGDNGMCFIKKEDISDGRIRLEGNWNGNIVYLSDLGEIKVLKTNFDFIESVENENICSNDKIEYNYKIINMETKILNERKINSKIELELKIQGFKIEEINMISKLDEDKNIQKLEKKIITKKFINSNISRTTINEDVNFLESGSSVEILKSGIKVSNIEKKISYNKVLAKAEADIKILYLYENEIKVFNTRIPIMSFIEMENVKEENIINLNYKIKKCIITNKVFDKGNINCDLEFEINCDMYEKKEITIIQDMYSLEKDINYSKKDVNIECVLETSNNVVEFNEQISLENFKEIYDYEYNIKKIETTDGKNYEGILEVIIYYSKEENNNLAIKNIEVPFIIKNISENCNFNLNFCEIKSNNNEVICNFKVECIENIKYEKISLLNECEIIDCKNKNTYSMIIYFVKPNDTIWKIAKMFKVSMESLIELNNISDPNKINIGEKLYIMK